MSACGARFLALVLTVAFAGSCNNDDGGDGDASSGSSASGSGASSGSSASSSSASGSGASGGSDASSGSGGSSTGGSGASKGGSSSGGEGNASSGGAGTTDGDCGLHLATKDCVGSARCEWTNEEQCQSGYCECNSGSWACVQAQGDCGGECPLVPMDTECGSSCSGEAKNCQCSCGGPNFSSCSCTDGEWACLGC